MPLSLHVISVYHTTRYNTERYRKGWQTLLIIQYYELSLSWSLSLQMLFHMELAMNCKLNLVGLYFFSSNIIQNNQITITRNDSPAQCCCHSIATTASTFGWQSNSEFCSRLQRSCTIFFIAVLHYTSTILLRYASSTTLICYTCSYQPDPSFAPVFCCTRTSLADVHFQFVNRLSVWAVYDLPVAAMRVMS